MLLLNFQKLQLFYLFHFYEIFLLTKEVENLLNLIFDKKINLSEILFHHLINLK